MRAIGGGRFAAGVPAIHHPQGVGRRNLGAMIILWLAFAVILVRALIGWEIKVSKTDSLTKKQARVLALACLPVLLTANERGLASPAVILYLVLFCLGACVLAAINSRKRA